MFELIRDPLDRRRRPAWDMIERLRRARGDAGHGVPVRACLRIAEHPREALLHLGRHGVLDPLGLFVRLPPLVSKEIDEHPLGKAVAPHDVRGERAPRLGKMHFFTTIERHEPFALETVEHFRDSRRGNSHEARQAGTDDTAALVGERVDRLEVLLDHWRAGDC